MRKYVLPVVVCAAIGALIVVLVEMSGDSPGKRPKGERAADTPESTDAPGIKVPQEETRTTLREHKWLRELERAMLRPDMKNARWFQQKVCEDIERIAADEQLSRNLLDLIREQGLESDDPKRRDVMLQILRVLQLEEATEMIDQEYYRARSPQERMLLMEAMSHRYHDPERASVWVLETALNAETEEQRHRAFEVLDQYSDAHDLVVATARKIYNSTTRKPQRLHMLESVARRATTNKNAELFLRERLAKPRAEELGMVLEQIPGWGTEEDAAYVESLVREFPAEADFLKERARMIRVMKKQMAKARAEEKRQKELEAEAEEEARAKADRDG